MTPETEVLNAIVARREAIEADRQILEAERDRLDRQLAGNSALLRELQDHCHHPAKTSRMAGLTGSAYDWCPHCGWDDR